MANARRLWIVLTRGALAVSVFVFLCYPPAFCSPPHKKPTPHLANFHATFPSSHGARDVCRRATFTRPAPAWSSRLTSTPIRANPRQRLHCGAMNKDSQKVTTRYYSGRGAAPSGKTVARHTSAARLTSVASHSLPALSHRSVPSPACRIRRTRVRPTLGYLDPLFEANMTGLLMNTTVIVVFGLSARSINRHLTSAC